MYDLSGIKYEMAKNINAQLETVGFVNLEGETESYRASEDKDAGGVGGSGIYQLGCGQ